MPRAFVFGFLAALTFAALAWRVDAGDGTRSVEDRLSAVEARLGAVEARLAGVAKAAAPASEGADESRSDGSRAEKAGRDKEVTLDSLRGTTMTIEFDQVTVLAALRAVAERGKLNLVMSPAATQRAKEGRVTLALANATVADALGMLTEPNDLSWELQAYGVVVVRDRSEGNK